MQRATAVVGRRAELAHQVAALQLVLTRVRRAGTPPGLARLDGDQGRVRAHASTITKRPYAAVGTQAATAESATGLRWRLVGVAGLLSGDVDVE